MRFRLILMVKDLLINDNEFLEVQVGGPHQVTVLLRRANEQELREGHTPSKTFCVTECRWETVSPKIASAFSSLADRRLPEGSNHTGSWPSELDEEGRFSEKTIVSLELLPKYFQDWSGQVYDELLHSSQKVINVVRWRRGLAGPHNPISQGWFQWSMDGAEWNHMPCSFEFEEEIIHGQRFQPGFGNEIVAILTETDDEPLGHELMREAWSNRSINPRSSLLLGIAAAEVGLKQCAATLAPAADWLIHNVPSPPIEKLLKEFLPQLKAKLDFGGAVLVPPTPVMDALKKGVTLRNLVTHKGACAPRRKTLKEILLAVQDLLWLLDYYCGFPWALSHMRTEVRQLLPD